MPSIFQRLYREETSLIFHMRIYGIRTESYIKFYNNYDDAFIEFLDMQKKYYAKHSQLSEVRVELTEMRAKLIIESLNDRLDQIDFFNSKNKK